MSGGTGRSAGDEPTSCAFGGSFAGPDVPVDPLCWVLFERGLQAAEGAAAFNGEFEQSMVYGWCAAGEGGPCLPGVLGVARHVHSLGGVVVRADGADSLSSKVHAPPRVPGGAFEVAEELAGPARLCRPRRPRRPERQRNTQRHPRPGPHRVDSVPITTTSARRVAKPPGNLSQLGSAPPRAREPQPSTGTPTRPASRATARAGSTC